jgi:hypothetical protein
MDIVFGFVLYVFGMIILAQVIRWSVHKGIEDAGESLRDDIRAVLEEMESGRGRETLDNQGER